MSVASASYPSELGRLEVRLQIGMLFICTASLAVTISMLALMPKAPKLAAEHSTLMTALGTQHAALLSIMKQQR